MSDTIGFYSQLMKHFIWEKAYAIDPISEQLGFRYDRYGNLIRFQDHGIRNSFYGWEKDHTIPKSHGGPDTLNNLEPVHWKANVQKSNNLSYSLQFLAKPKTNFTFGIFPQPQ